jgi:hypothetical protein
MPEKSTNNRKPEIQTILLKHVIELPVPRTSLEKVNISKQTIYPSIIYILIHYHFSYIYMTLKPKCMNLT